MKDENKIKTEKIEEVKEMNKSELNSSNLLDKLYGSDKDDAILKMNVV